MNTTDFNNYMVSKAPIAAAEGERITEAIIKYPYCAGLHFLLSVIEAGKDVREERKSRAAAYAANRFALYDFVAGIHQQMRSIEESEGVLETFSFVSAHERASGEDAFNASPNERQTAEHSQNGSGNELIIPAPASFQKEKEAEPQRFLEQGEVIEETIVEQEEKAAVEIEQPAQRSISELQGILEQRMRELKEERNDETSLMEKEPIAEESEAFKAEIDPTEHKVELFLGGLKPDEINLTLDPVAEEEDIIESPGDSKPQFSFLPVLANKESENKLSFSIDDNLPHTFTFWLRRIRKIQEQQNEKSGTSMRRVITTDIEAGFIKNALHHRNLSTLERGVVIEFDLNKKEDRILEKFIREEPIIRPVQIDDISVEDKSEQSVADSMEIVSETMAKIYQEQQFFDKAISVYEKLSLKYPAKSAYFAAQAQKIRQENR